jgi:fatty acid desaturase
MNMAERHPAPSTASETLDSKAARAACGISHAQEKQIARDLAPAIAWPTLALAVTLPVLFATFATLGFTHALPLWVCTPILALVSYANYTLVHESIHGNVVSSPRSVAWVNTVVGWIGSIGMGLGWPILMRTHLLHHSHTNTEKDPDIIVKGTFGALLMKWVRSLPTALVPIALLRFTDPPLYERLKGVFSPADIILSSAVALLRWRCSSWRSSLGISSIGSACGICRSGLGF